MAAANGFATETLGNIRTVKAFSTESYELNKYNNANDNALLKGIYDALGINYICFDHVLLQTYFHKYFHSSIYLFSRVIYKFHI